jgi:hypothetical protein
MPPYYSKKQTQERLITRLKNIRKFFNKHIKRNPYYELMRGETNIIIGIEKDKLKQMKDGRKKK